MTGVLAWFLDPANWMGPTGIPARLTEHVEIAGLAIAAATIIGLPIGLYIGHTGRAANFAINTANIGRAVPSYALMVPSCRSRWHSPPCSATSRKQA